MWPPRQRRKPGAGNGRVVEPPQGDAHNFDPGSLTAAVGLLHLAVAFASYDHLTLDALWFAGSGLAVVLIGVLTLLARGSRRDTAARRTAVGANAAGLVLATKMRQNIAIAAAFNALRIALAVLRLVTPMAIGIIVASVDAVLLSTLSLLRLNLGASEAEESESLVEMVVPARRMHCDACTRQITKRLSGASGVRKVVPDQRRTKDKVVLWVAAAVALLLLTLGSGPSSSSERTPLTHRSPRSLLSNDFLPMIP